MATLKSLIHSCTSHLSREERQEAIEMLVFIGLIHSQTFKIDMASLRHSYRKFCNINISYTSLCFIG